ncbi:MAG: septum formation initiator family protein [bacterium]|nr:septum formation initiator family protein [bacterium]
MKKKHKAKSITKERILITVVLVAMGLLIFQPREGLLFLSIRVMQKKRIERSIDETKVKMVLQQRKIDLLKSNKNHIEKIIREETNMIKPNEKIMKR